MQVYDSLDLVGQSSKFMEVCSKKAKCLNLGANVPWKCKLSVIKYQKKKDCTHLEIAQANPKPS